MTKTIERPKYKTRTRPPGKWRNWYRAKQAFDSIYVGPKKAGEAYPGTGIWPSHEIAEAKAHGPNSSVTLGFSTWLGAYPEGERP